MDYEDVGYRKLHKMVGSDYNDLSDLHRIEQEQKMVKDLLPGYKISSTPSLHDNCIQTDLVADDLDDMSGFSFEKEVASEMESMGITLSSTSQADISKRTEQLSIHEAYLMPDFIGIKFSQKTHILLKDTKKTTTVTLNPELLDTDEISLKVMEWPIGVLSLTVGGYTIFPNMATDLPHYINVSTEFKKFSLEENMLYGMDPQHAERERAAWRQKERRERKQLKELQDDPNQGTGRKSKQKDRKTKIKERDTTATADKFTQTVVHFEPNSFSEEISEPTEGIKGEQYLKENSVVESSIENLRKKQFNRKKDISKEIMKGGISVENLSRDQDITKENKEYTVKVNDKIMMSNDDDATQLTEEIMNTEESYVMISNPPEDLSQASLKFRRFNKTDRKDKLDDEQKAVNWKSILQGDLREHTEISGASIDSKIKDITYKKSGNEKSLKPAKIQGETAKQKFFNEKKEREFLPDSIERDEDQSREEVYRTSASNVERPNTAIQNNVQQNFHRDKKDKKYVPLWNTEKEEYGPPKPEIYNLNWKEQQENRRNEQKEIQDAKQITDHERKDEMKSETTELSNQEHDEAYSYTPSGNLEGQLDTLDKDDRSDNTTKDVSEIINSQTLSYTRATVDQLYLPETVDEVSDLSENENDTKLTPTNGFKNSKNELNKDKAHKTNSKDQLVINDSSKKSPIRDGRSRYLQERNSDSYPLEVNYPQGIGNDSPPIVDSSQIMNELGPLKSEFNRIVAELKKIELETEMLSVSPIEAPGTDIPPRTETFHSRTSKDTIPRANSISILKAQKPSVHLQAVT